MVEPMARPLRVQVEGAAYHVLSRGNQGDDIFSEEEDRDQFMHILQRGVERYGIELYAYCVMGSHYHLLLSAPPGILTRFMHYAGSSYGSYQRRCRGKIGHVFAGRYRSLCVEKDRYLHELSRYIHLNPVRAGLSATPEVYRWSSCPFYIGEISCPPWLDRAWILKRYGSFLIEAQAHYRLFLQEGMGQPPEYTSGDIYGQAVLGSEEFVRRSVEGTPARKSFGEVSARRCFQDGISLEVLNSAVCRHFGLTSGEGLRNPATSAERSGRKMFLWLAREHTTMFNREIAVMTGHRNPSTISRQHRMIWRCMEKDPAFSERWLGEVAAIMSRIKG